MLGALANYIVHADPDDFQPMKANFSILPPMEGMEKSGRRQRAQAYAERALRDLDEALASVENFQYV
jgi:methylenetetrahydrofolate--tRNA-(uracil-5-)-methyltransferase